MGWRRRTAWERRDWAALAVLAGSVALGVFLVSSDVLRVGIRQGLAFLLVFVFIGAAVVLLVRHLPLPVLHFAPPVTLIVGGLIVAVVSDEPVRYLAIAASVLGVIQLILRLREHRGQRLAPAAAGEDTSREDTDAKSHE